MVDALDVTYTSEGTGADQYNVRDRLRKEIWVSDFGVTGDGTDESSKIQDAINAANALGGAAVRFHHPKDPATATYFRFDTGLTIPGGVALLGEGKYQTILRYTGTGTAISASGAGNNSISISDLTLQLSGTGAVGIDASRLISSTFRSVRIAKSGSPTGLIGVKAVITTFAWNSYFNVFEDCTFDALATAINIDSTSNPVQYANRWRLVAPTFLDCGDCLDIVKVHGMEIIAPVFDEYTGTAIKLGAGVNRLTLVAIRNETNQAGASKLFDIDLAANRVQVIGYSSHAGALGLGSPARFGDRGLLIGEADTGLQMSGPPVSVSPATITGITKANPAVVTTSAAHGFSNGDIVFIKDVGGMTQVNKLNFTVASATATTFALAAVDSTSFDTYTSGGTASLRTATTRYVCDNVVGGQLHGVESISGTLTAGRNLRGTFSISGTSPTSDPITFANAEPDNSYYLVVTPVGKSGSPAPDSLHVESISKSAGSFTVTLKAAPGSGSSRTFDWILIR